MWSACIVKYYFLHCSFLLFAFGFFSLIVNHYLFRGVPLSNRFISGLITIGALALPQYINDNVLIWRWDRRAFELFGQTFSGWTCHWPYDLAIGLSGPSHHLLVFTRVKAWVQLSVLILVVIFRGSHLLAMGAISVCLTIDSQASIRFIVPRLEPMWILVWRLFFFSASMDNTVSLRFQVLLLNDGVFITRARLWFAFLRALRLFFGLIVFFVLICLFVFFLMKFSLLKRWYLLLVILGTCRPLE